MVVHYTTLLFSDVIYVRVKIIWHYTCRLMDLFNHEIIGYSAAPGKDAELVYIVFANKNISLTYGEYSMPILAMSLRIE